MKTDKRTQLLKILSDASQSISSAALANMLGTSEPVSYTHLVEELMSRSNAAAVWKR